MTATTKLENCQNQQTPGQTNWPTWRDERVKGGRNRIASRVVSSCLVLFWLCFVLFCSVHFYLVMSCLVLSCGCRGRLHWHRQMFAFASGEIERINHCVSQVATLLRPPIEKLAELLSSFVEPLAMRSCDSRPKVDTVCTAILSQISINSPRFIQIERVPLVECTFPIAITISILIIIGFKSV